jgi:hypothetical protein
MSNIVSFPGGHAVHPELGKIPLARLHAGAKPIDHQNANSTYLGRVDLSDDETTAAYVKDLNKRELGNELLTASICAMAGLPMPRAFLVGSDAGDLPLSKAPTASDGTRLMFGLEEIKAPSLRRNYNTDLHFIFENLRAKVAAWPQVSMLYILDSWAANVDRNLGNILVQGDDIWLIDHERCYTGPKWKPKDLSPSKIYKNKVKFWLSVVIDDPRRQQISNEISALSAKFAAVDLAEAAERSQADRFISTADMKALSKFLAARIAHISALTADALKVDAA